jgi:hypothetical protein
MKTGIKKYGQTSPTKTENERVEVLEVSLFFKIKWK